MPNLIEHIDAIARREQRDVLYLEFHPQPCELARGYRYLLDEQRGRVLQWLDANGHPWQPCGSYADGSGMQPYLGQVHVATAHDAELPDYRQLRDHLELPDGNMRIPGVRFYLMPLKMAAQNAAHDAPGFWNSEFTNTHRTAMTFDADRLKQFMDIPFVPQPFASAKIPRVWAESIGITEEDLMEFEIGMADLPDTKLSRYQVRDICRAPGTHVLIGYICAMAWGAQGVGPTSRHAISAWAARAALIPALEEIKAGGLALDQAYKLFCGDGVVTGLGVSYFTKLIFFFMPEMNGYIVDQWTAKSINYLTGRDVVIIDDEAPTRRNTEVHYAQYRAMVDALVEELRAVGQHNTGEEVEQRLFSSGGKGDAVGAWRAIIRLAFGEGKDEAIEEAAPIQPNKMQQATAIYLENPGAKSRVVIQLFIDQAGLTRAGASTYYYSIKGKQKKSGT